MHEMLANQILLIHFETVRVRDVLASVCHVTGLLSIDSLQFAKQARYQGQSLLDKRAMHNYNHCQDPTLTSAFDHTV